MYAPPPSAPKPIISSGNNGTRPTSSPGGPRNRSSVGHGPSALSLAFRRAETAKQDKRSTWSGATSRGVRRRHSLQGMKAEGSGGDGAGPSGVATSSQYVPFPPNARRMSKTRTQLSMAHGAEVEETIRRLSTILGEQSDEAAHDDPTPALSITTTSAGTSPATAFGFDEPSEDQIVSIPDPPSPFSASLDASRPSLQREDSFTAAPPMIKRRRRGSSVSASPVTMGASQPQVLQPPFSTPIGGDQERSKRRAANASHSHSHKSLSITPNSLSSPAKLNLLQTTRHPLSLAALQGQAQSALASKRFTAAHLLALRFGDAGLASQDADPSMREDLELLTGEDESYWEDVRSVMGLLTTALEDAAVELGYALEGSQQAKARDMQVTPLDGVFPHRDDASSDATARDPKSTPSPLPDQSRTTSPIRALFTPTRVPPPPSRGVGFAPLPSPLSRYMSHINSLGDALDAARAQLKECATLAETHHTLHQKHQRFDRPLSPEWTTRLPLDATLQAWEDLRRDLGNAVRECERGRGSLLDFIGGNPPSRSSSMDDIGEDDDDVPGLAHDQSSNEGDMSEAHISLLPVHSAIYDPATAVGLSFLDIAGDEDSHLQDADTKLMPPPGIEEVFEFDAQDDEDTEDTATIRRKRNRLSRAERISVMKAKRESVQSPPPPDGWGLGGEVVRELKSVISRVEEKRRELANKRLSEIGELVTAAKPVVVIASTLRPSISTSTSRAQSPIPELVEHGVAF